MKHKTKINAIPPVLLFLLTGPVLLAQAEAAAGSESTLLSHVYENLVLYLGFAVVVVALLSLLYLVNSLMQVEKMRLMREHGIEAMEKTGLVKRESLWSRLYKRWTAAVPIEKEEEILFDHEFDGIRELDNRLPPWWVALFYITIAFGVVYLVVYHWTDYGVSSREAYEIEIQQAEEAVEAYLARQSDLVDENTAEMLVDPAEIALGKTIFDANCVACHGPLGEGAQVGPNLADIYWIHGGGVKNIFSTVKYGVPEKGMIAWKAQLRPVDIHRVASYVWSLQGTNPANSKGPEGDPYEIPDPEAADQADADPDATDPEPMGMNEE